MTVVQNAYVVVPYTEKLANSHIPEGMRLSVVRWRETAEVKKSGKKVPAPVAVLVPAISLELSQPIALRSALRDALDEMQDNRVRNIINQYLNDDTSVNLLSIRISPDEVSEGGIADWLATEKTGGRLSGDAIKAWFQATVKSVITDRAMSRNPDITEKQLEQAINGYQATFMKLASPVTPIAPPILEKLAELLAESVATNGSNRVDEQIAIAITKRMPRNEDDMLMDL